VWLPATLEGQEALVAADPARFFRPPYVGHKGWIGVVLDTRPDWAMVDELVREAYRRIAPARLAAQVREPPALRPKRAKPRRSPPATGSRKSARGSG
jgi:hypothetical protein